MSPGQLSGVIEGRGRRGQQHHQVSFFIFVFTFDFIFDFISPPAIIVYIRPIRLTEAGEEQGGKRPSQGLVGGF